jgi:hypothetical protein
MNFPKVEINLFMDFFFVENQSHLLRPGHKIHTRQKNHNFSFFFIEFGLLFLFTNVIYAYTKHFI